MTPIKAFGADDNRGWTRGYSWVGRPDQRLPKYVQGEIIMMYGKMIKKFMEDHMKKMGPPEPTEKERAEATKKMEEKPTAAYGRKKQGAGGGHAIIE